MKTIIDSTERPVSARKGLTLKGYVTIVGTLVLAAALTMGAGFTSQSASAATPPTVELCNGVYNVGGQRVECHVTVANTLDIATGVGSSVVSETICVGSPGTPECGSALVTNYEEVAPQEVAPQDVAPHQTPMFSRTAVSMACRMRSREPSRLSLVRCS